MAGFLAAALVPAAGLADPPVNVYNSFEAGKSAHDAGMVKGEVESVDYSSGTIVVRTGHGRAEVAVLPSTTIYKGDQYATLADIHRGLSVAISVSDVDGRLVAQIIRLK